LVNELHRVFNKYEYQDVIDEIDPLRMEPNESLETFVDHFLHLRYESMDEVVD